MKKLSLLFTTLLLSVSVFLYADDDKHELENMHASIDAIAHKNARHITTKEQGNKEYIFGKTTSYNKKGEAIGGKILWPYAEYAFASKMTGGQYNITVHYRIEKDKLPSNARILVGLDLQEAKELEIKQKLINTVKATFDAHLLKGKNHTIKLWLPSEGVEIQKIEVRRALIKKKDIE